MGDKKEKQLEEKVNRLKSSLKFMEKEYNKLITFLLPHKRLLKEYQNKVNKGEPIFIGHSKVE